MKKVRLRIVSLFIAVTMLLAMMPSTAMAAGEVVKTGQVQNSTIYYELTRNDDGEDTLTLRFYEKDTAFPHRLTAARRRDPDPALLRERHRGGECGRHAGL